MRLSFPNGYGVSIVEHGSAYATPGESVEVAVTHGESLCYATPITGDVLPYVPHADIPALLVKVAALEPRSPSLCHPPHRGSERSHFTHAPASTR